MDLGLCQTGLWRCAARKNDNAERGEWPFCAGHSRYFMALLQILCGTPGAHRAINHFATTYAIAPGESPGVEAAAPRRGGVGGGGDLCADSEDGLNA